MSLARITVAALLAVALGLSGCGLKGDPIKPGSKKDLKRQQERQEQQQKQQKKSAE
jgi:predicted small lipoprotein YifL